MEYYKLPQAMDTIPDLVAVVPLPPSMPVTNVSLLSTQPPLLPPIASLSQLLPIHTTPLLPKNPLTKDKPPVNRGLHHNRKSGHTFHS